MKVIIAGSRSIDNKNHLIKAIEEAPFGIDKVITGGADGVDTLAINWCIDNSINFEVFYPDYEEHGKKAPIIRNRKMSENGDALIAIWDGESSGTKNMINTAKDKGLEVYVYNTGTSLSDF
jgi:hypothetical protein